MMSVMMCYVNTDRINEQVQMLVTIVLFHMAAKQKVASNIIAPSHQLQNTGFKFYQNVNIKQ